MKNLQEIYEGVLDDDFAISKSVDKNVAIDVITSWIGENYEGDGTLRIKILKKPGSDGKYMVDLPVKDLLHLKKTATSLTNDLFVWRNVSGEFSCKNNPNIKTLEGAPRTCWVFDCRDCENLETLKGGPDKVRALRCDKCTSLKTLEGAPKVCEALYCDDCTNLISLKGSPYKLTIFFCNDCSKLTSLEGGPNEVTTMSCKNLPKLNTLRGFPEYVKYKLDCRGQGPKIDTDKLDEMYAELKTPHALQKGGGLFYSIWID
jgi:hypothetical protein